METRSGILTHADFVTFPSLYEGFGNAFLEAIYFKKPLMVNRYAIFVSDIEPKGFDLVHMDANLTAETVQAVKEILKSPQRTAEMVEHNYEIARQHFSYGVLKDQLDALIVLSMGQGCVAHNAVDYKTRPDANDLALRPRVVQFAYLKN